MVRSLLEQVSGNCMHFTGVQHDVCKAGISYDDARAAASPPKLPCIRWIADGATCPKAKFPTEEEAKAEVAQMEAHLAEVLARPQQGLCIDCGAPVESYRQSGVCSYALPCGHRFGQADAAAQNRALAELRRQPTPSTPDNGERRGG